MSSVLTLVALSYSKSLPATLCHGRSVSSSESAEENETKTTIAYLKQKAASTAKRGWLEVAGRGNV